MPRQFECNVLRRRRMFRNIGERGSALADIFLIVRAPKNRLQARLVRISIEDERPRLAELAHAAGKGPAGDDPRQRRHVGLRISAIHAERMQFEDFAREILVEATAGCADRPANSVRSIVGCRDRTASPDGSRPPAACRRSGREHAAGSRRARKRRRRCARIRPSSSRRRNGWSRSRRAVRQNPAAPRQRPLQAGRGLGAKNLLLTGGCGGSLGFSGWHHRGRDPARPPP